MGTVADRVVRACEEAGVGLACGLDDPPGLFASLRRSSIRTLIVHDERSGAFMADGYARASGRPALCAGVSGPGATNLLTGVLEAFRSSTALLAFVAEARGERVGRPAFQEAPHESLFAPLTKGVVRLDRLEDGGVALQQAIALSGTGRPRPVALLADPGVLSEDDGQADALPLRLGVSPVPTRTVPAPSAISAAVTALLSAERPVILAGNGVHLSCATAELQTVAERYRIPVATSLYGKGAISETCSLALGVASAYTGGTGGSGVVANRVLREADVLLVVGSDLDPVTTSGGAWPGPQTTLIRIDVDERELLAYDGLALSGDARETLRQIVERERDVPRDASYLHWLQQTCGEAAALRAEVREQDLQRADDGGVWPGAIVHVIGRCLREGDAIVTDASYSSAWALDRVQQSWAGRHVFAPRGSGVLGWGLPAAMGVKLARPRDAVVCLTGDGGLLFSLAELETAVREKIDVTLVLLNNESYGFQRHADMLRQGLDHADLAIPGVDWMDVARGFGWRSERVTTLAGFTEEFEQSLAADGPAFIEVVVDKEARPPIAMFDEPILSVVGH